MFVYYVRLALLSLKRNLVLTSLMIAAIGVGIGASMTTLTVFRAMDADPIPRKSKQLFTVQIDNYGPNNKKVVTGDSEGLQEQVTYLDAMALMKARAGTRQSAMYVTGLPLEPPDRNMLPLRVQIRAAYTDFFTMFDVPFLYGGPWTGADDEDRSYVVVITRELNDQLFRGANSVGKTLSFDKHAYRIVGVTDTWHPTPKFYDLVGSKYGLGEQAFMPLTRTIDSRMTSWESTECLTDPEGFGDWDVILTSECVWLQFWVELPTRADAARYGAFLNNYAADQQRSGRFHWGPRTRMFDVKQWLVHEHVIKDEFRILVLVSFSFLFVCLLNAMGLMLAKIMSRAPDIGVRRALGANRGAIFGQCLIEAGVVGLAGSIIGLVLTGFGLLGVRGLVSPAIGRLAHLSAPDVGIAVGLSIVATMLAGLYPTWRASRVEPAWQLKAQ
jgi:putative ABC transport system permease protein